MLFVDVNHFKTSGNRIQVPVYIAENPKNCNSIFCSQRREFLAVLHSSLIVKVYSPQFSPQLRFSTKRRNDFVHQSPGIQNLKRNCNNLETCTKGYEL